ncbi:MAG: ferrous iron transport protein B [Oscillospiraceae bacterium]|nr:ferrous iron transport protein B [Oscillospiraceae bacterium]
MKKSKTVALVGNPNVGKSTVFNSLTGLRQHTGNWPGKTVSSAWGRLSYKGTDFQLVDLPGTYSLTPCSIEEEISRDFICFGHSDAVVVVADATNLERNLNFVLQVLEITKNVVVCINLIDESKRKKIEIDLARLSKRLQTAVVATNARNSKDLRRLLEEIYKVSYFGNFQNPKINYSKDIEFIISELSPILEKKILDNLYEGNFLKFKKKYINPNWLSTKFFDVDENFKESLKKNFKFELFDQEVLKKINKIKSNSPLKKASFETIRDVITTDIASQAKSIYKECVKVNDKSYNKRDEKIDKFLTSKATGVPTMLCLLGFIFWLTITASNYPSQLIANFLFAMEEKLTLVFEYERAPDWLHGILVLGVYKTLSWVVSVMLPPMAIFFPLFTILEDFGYLPRVAFNLDGFFRRAGAHGKQALTMCMGFGCNACGVTGCRIIESERERLIAILTNNFVPCNGRFPILISIITMFFVGDNKTFIGTILSSLMLVLIVLGGIFMTFACSKILSKTLLKGLPSSFTLELPPYRRPQFFRIIVRSIFDRTISILLRAIAVAAPAGLVIWLMANIKFGDFSLLAICSEFLDPFARMIGLDGIILLAFILGFPANEIVMPIIIMSYLCSGSILDLASLQSLKILLVDNGWTPLTAVCTMIFSLMHFPCGTTCLTIKKETQSLKWVLVSAFLPTVCGMIVCFLITLLSKLTGVIA